MVIYLTLGVIIYFPLQFSASPLSPSCYTAPITCPNSWASNIGATPSYLPPSLTYRFIRPAASLRVRDKKILKIPGTRAGHRSVINGKFWNVKVYKKTAKTKNFEIVNKKTCSWKKFTLYEKQMCYKLNT